MAATAGVIWLHACVRYWPCLSSQRLLMGIFSGELISEGLITGRNFRCVQKWVGLESKNSQQHKDNSLKMLTLKVHGLIFGRALYWAHFPREGLFLFYLYLFFFVLFLWWASGGGGGGGAGRRRRELIIGILWHVIFNEKSFRFLGIRVKTPRARFSKFPKSLRARKVITKIF